MSDTPRRPFTLDGNFLGFVGYTDKPKYIHLNCDDQVIQVKLAKNLRAVLATALQPGMPLRITGRAKLSSRSGQLSLKAERVALLSDCVEASVNAGAADWRSDRVNIRVCQKSKCRQRGSRRIYAELENAVRDRGLQAQISLNASGCLKRCSSAPNLLTTPGERYYKSVRLEDIPTILGEYCTV